MATAPTMFLSVAGRSIPVRGALALLVGALVEHHQEEINRLAQGRIEIDYGERDITVRTVATRRHPLQARG